MRDTRHHVGQEITHHHGSVGDDLGFWEVFRRASYKDRNLFAASQAGLVNNLNFGMSWGIFPLLYASFGLAVGRIGILNSVYPGVWGVLQTVTGPLSDRWGRKGLIVAGMWVQGCGLFLDRRHTKFRLVVACQRSVGAGDCDGLSDPDRRRFRCIPSLLAGAFAQRLSLLARPWLRGRRTFRGVIADALGMAWAIRIVAALSFVSGAIVALLMRETKR